MQKIIDFMKEHNVKTVLDIGANVGNWSYHVKQALPDVEIFMIEANSKCTPWLEKSGIPFKIACLSDGIKTVKLYKNKNNEVCTGTSYYIENTEHYTEDLFDEIETITLDSLILDVFKSRKGFDYVKMDTQGSEIDIIKGGMDTILASHYLQIECSLIEYNKNAPGKVDVEAFMSNNFFGEIEKVEDHYYGGTQLKIQEDWIFKNGRFK